MKTKTKQQTGTAPAVHSSDLLSGVEQIAEERRRQIAEEGWTGDHDDEHACGEMAIAAKCYCEQAVGRRWLEPKKYRKDVPRDDWPWATKWWKPKSPIRDLVRAGALIAAEIDRLRRLMPQPDNKEVSESARNTNKI